MKLLRAHIHAAETCGHLLDKVNVWLRTPNQTPEGFDLLCFVGPNGAGKSQFLQIIAEIFQAAFHACVGTEERADGNPSLRFELEYLIRPQPEDTPKHVKISRLGTPKRRCPIKIECKQSDGTWAECDLDEGTTKDLLPRLVVGYTSGDNETLSLPFLISRSGYASDVAKSAKEDEENQKAVPGARLMLIDYGTHLEALVANLLLGHTEQNAELLREVRVDALHSFRCIVQLAHQAAPAALRKHPKYKKRVELTEELRRTIDQLKRCATCHDFYEDSETYVFDFIVTDETKAAFMEFWPSPFDLYTSFHKLSMLNDLTIPWGARKRFERDTRERHFAARLPEPQDEDKVFRFESVSFTSSKQAMPVDYVSLSDGEHQRMQVLGMLSMLSFRNVLFLLDEPESHFNPEWRVGFVKAVENIVTRNQSFEQDCILTTHSPFVPSDLPKEKVLVFKKAEGSVVVSTPMSQTYGADFNSIIEDCFDIKPPISAKAKGQIDALLLSTDADAIRSAMKKFGQSVERIELADRLRWLSKEQREE